MAISLNHFISGSAKTHTHTHTQPYKQNKSTTRLAFYGKLSCLLCGPGFGGGGAAAAADGGGAARSQLANKAKHHADNFTGKPRTKLFAAKQNSRRRGTNGKRMQHIFLISFRLI